MEIKVVTNQESRDPLSKEIMRLKSTIGIEDEIEVVSIEKKRIWSFTNYLLIIEDGTRDFLSIIKSAKESKAFDRVLVCDTISVTKLLISALNTSPDLITIDFLLGAVTTFYEDTSDLYQLLKLKFPKTEIVGFTNYENAGDDELGSQARKLIDLFVRNGESVYDKFSFRIHGTLANVFRDKIRLLRSREEKEENDFEKKKLLEDTIVLDAELPTSSGKKYLVGQSRAMRLLYRRLQQIKYVDSSVLILGESGSGKDPVAQAIYEDSPRGKSSVFPYQEVNCGEFSEDANSAISKLFGHKKGSFTGATENKRGILEIAHNGTAFFDEVGNIPLGVQEKLLRYLDKGEFYRLGDDEKKFKTDARLIFATNANPEVLLKQDRLRFDFYQRIKTFKISVPPLSDRKDDIPLLIHHFLSDKRTLIENFRNGEIKFIIEDSVVAFLKEQTYTGNVRELRNILVRSMAYARTNDDRITMKHAIEAIREEGEGVIREKNCEEVRGFLDKIEKIIEQHFLASTKVDVQEIVPYFSSTKTNKVKITRPFFSKHELTPRKPCIKKLLDENPGDWPLIRAKKINLLAGEKPK